MCAASSSSRAAAADLSSAGAARSGALCGPKCCLLSSVRATFEWIALVVGFFRSLLIQIFLHLMLLWGNRADFVFLWHVNVGSRRSSRRSVICASLFGVGAPEALVIGVVALLVFGPKGLAEVNLRIQPCQLYSFCSGSYFTLCYCACEVLEIEKH